MQLAEYTEVLDIYGQNHGFRVIKDAFLMGVFGKFPTWVTHRDLKCLYRTKF